MRAREIRLLLPAGVAAICACSSAEPTRPQIVLSIDTDLPVVGQLREESDLSPDAAIDTLLVEVLDSSGHTVDFRLLTLPDPLDWPVSMGITGKVRLRIRAFRALFAMPQEVESGARTVTLLVPTQALAVDRLVEVEPSEGGVERILVVLRGDCLGVPPRFLEPASTCVDAEHIAASPSDAFPRVDTVPSEVGRWSRAREVGCTRASGPDQVCIPGGFSILGDRSLSGVSDLGSLDAVPLRPVQVSPFLMDAMEFTVGRFRALVNEGRIEQALLPPASEVLEKYEEYCTWAGAEDGNNDLLPLNCMSFDAARTACELEGGQLPTEAQWEHAARGRGERRLYPWGDEEPTCCAASLSRHFDVMSETSCDGSGAEPVGSHLSAACRLKDMSRDGVVDLGGSMSEATFDKLREFDAPCWNVTGVPVDPACVDDTATSRVSRGGSWSSGLARALSPRRHSFQPSPADGFRCVHGGVGP